MTPDDKNADLIAAIADRKNLEWSQEQLSDPLGAQLARLDQIARAFRATDVPATPAMRPILFSWSHLKVIEKIGEGGFGEVFRAYDPLLKRDVALKLNRTDHAPDIENRIITAEARRMARLRHPNILAIHGADEDQGRVGIWSDLLHGQTLDNYLLQVGRLSPKTVLELAIPLADATALIHKQGLCHGDIKPANIMVTDDGSPVLMDFGAARDSLSTAPNAAGSPLLMAPEQFAGARQSPATDIYSLGAVFYNALAGRLPVQAESLDALIALHESGSTPDYSGIPWLWRNLLRSMLNNDAAHRPDARNVHQQLLRLQSARRRIARTASVCVVILALSTGTLAATLAYRTATQSRERSQLIKDVLVQAVQESLPTARSGPTSIEAMFSNLENLSEQQLTAYPDALAEMRLTVGDGLGQLGEAERGLRIAERGLELLIELRPEAAKDLGWGWSIVSTLRLESGDPAGAEEAALEALRQYDLLRGHDDEESAAGRLTVRNRLAIQLTDQGRWLEQVSVTRQLLEDRREHYGEGHINLAVDHYNLALAQIRVGEFEAALDNAHQSRKLMEAAGNGRTPHMAFILIALSAANRELGRFSEAKTLLDEAREILEAVLPEGHPNFSALDQNLAMLLARTGRLDEAAELFAEIMTRGTGNDSTLGIYTRNLAGVLMDAQRWNEASQHYQAYQETMTRRDAPLQPFLQAAVAYASFRSGSQAESPATTMAAALTTLRESGYEKIPEYHQLQRWLDSLNE